MTGLTSYVVLGEENLDYAAVTKHSPLAGEVGGRTVLAKCMLSGF